jgi:hypothetical protein
VADAFSEREVLAKTGSHVWLNGTCANDIEVDLFWEEKAVKSKALVVQAVKCGLLAFMIVLGYASAGIAQDTKPGQILITNVNIFDGKSDKLTEGMSVLVEGNLIKQVGKDLEAGKGATVIDGSQQRRTALTFGGGLRRDGRGSSGRSGIRDLDGSDALAAKPIWFVTIYRVSSSIRQSCEFADLVGDSPSVPGRFRTSRARVLRCGGPAPVPFSVIVGSWSSCFPVRWMKSVRCPRWRLRPTDSRADEKPHELGR